MQRNSKQRKRRMVDKYCETVIYYSAIYSSNG